MKVSALTGLLFIAVSRPVFHATRLVTSLVSSRYCSWVLQPIPRAISVVFLPARVAEPDEQGLTFKLGETVSRLN